MNYYFQYKLIRVIAFLFGFLPFSFLLWCARRAGDLIFFCAPRRRKIAIDNITKAFGDSLSEPKKRDVARTAFQSLASSLVELFMIEKITPKAKELFTIVGSEHLKEAQRRGKGTVLIISHLGSWEYLAFYPYIMDEVWSVVVRKIKNPYLNDYIKSLRLLTTVTPIDKINSIRPLLKELKKNHVVAVAIDQWAGDGGLWLNFFGTKTSTTSIPARLAKKTGCALVPGYCMRMPSGKYEINIHPQVLVDPEDESWEQATTEQLNGFLETQIKKYPKQWLWGHRRWKKEPSQTREA